MKFQKVSGIAFATLSLLATSATAQMSSFGNSSQGIQRVLLISIDGMHAIDFANCVYGIPTVNSGNPYCPTLAALAQSGVSYTEAATTKPSDSFPGMVAQATGGTPRSGGIFYDVSYDRALSPPQMTTPYGIPGGYCPGVVGTQVGFDEEIDFDLTQLNAGGGINTAYLPRDPTRHCAFVYPHNFLRVNTIFEVIKSTGGYTAWSDKHPSYDFLNGPSGKGVDDLYTPEINSAVVSVPTCPTIPDTSAVDAWTSSFQNIQCYDSLKVNAIINEIDGKTHDGSASAPVPNIFGMNFQAVSVGEKLVEGSVTGGYVDSQGTPSASLLNEIEYVDTSLGTMVTELQKNGLYDSTLIIVSAKHGQSPIDPARVLRIPADNSALSSPATILGGIVAQSSEDDVSLIWLSDQSQTASAVATLGKSEATFGGGEILAGNTLQLQFNNPLTDSRTPDIIVATTVGVIYTGGKGKVAEHGGFALDDRNVMMLVSNPNVLPGTITSPVFTTQIAPTILAALGLDPQRLQAVQQEGTEVLPGLPFLARRLIYVVPFEKDKLK